MNISRIAKFVAALVGGVSSWASFVIASEAKPITGDEWDLLQKTLVAAFVVWLVPNAVARVPAFRRQTEGGGTRATDAGRVEWGWLVFLFFALLILHWFGVIPPR